MPEVLQQFGRVLMIAGAVILVIGAVLAFSQRIPWLGRLPGDFVIEKRHFTVYFPLATSILLSIVLTLLFWLIGRR